VLTGGGVRYCVYDTLFSRQPCKSFRPLFVPFVCTDNQSLVQRQDLSRRALSLGIGSGAAAAGIRASHITHPAHAAPAEPCPNVLEQ